MLDLDDEILAVAHQWVMKAGNDLKNAAHTVKLTIERGPAAAGVELTLR